MKKHYKQIIAEETLYSYNKREVFLDNKIVEDYFSSKNGLKSLRYSETIDEEINNYKKNKLELIKEIIEYNLPYIERQVIRWIYFDEMKQEGIAKLLNISQEMVSYYKSRAEKRIKYYLKTKYIGIENMRSELQPIVTNKQLDALIMYFKCHNQNIIAKQFKVTQSAISTRLKLGLKQIERESQNNLKLKKYYNVFKDLFLYNSLQTSQTKSK